MTSIAAATWIRERRRSNADIFLTRCYITTKNHAHRVVVQSIRDLVAES